MSMTREQAIEHFEYLSDRVKDEWCVSDKERAAHDAEFQAALAALAPAPREGLPRIVIDVDAGRLLVDGEEFPLPYAGADPTIVEAPDGAVYPGVTFTVACADVQVIKPSEVIPPDAGE